METAKICCGIKISGTVQGVGFRPFIYALAGSLGLAGTVRNTGMGVEIEIEGERAGIEEFIDSIKYRPPLLARLNGIKVEQKPASGYKGFSILKSTGQAAGEGLIPPDAALCPECAGEILDPGDRRHRYPFTNCTNCGPRYTIIKGLPYDRRFTSMEEFMMCPDCAGEYGDPADRRFHAQPVTCPSCGPRVWLTDRRGKELPGDWLNNVRRLLGEGGIMALKGLGGFHLACDAKNGSAVAELRRRKRRPSKPFAVMCRDLDSVREYCLLDSREAELLASPSAPIVLLPRRAELRISSLLAPGMATLGVMLPYTPLHRLIFSGGTDLLVMTSGNVSGQPIIKGNAEALDGLGDIADYFLLHNREIVNRCDDSVLAVVEGEEYFYRRSRGYIPLPVDVPAGEQGPVVFGPGGDLKNAFCLSKSGRAFMSPHLGDLDTLEARENYMETYQTLSGMINAVPGVAAVDMHPGYHSSVLGRGIKAQKTVPVQHHHAHMAACMADNGLTGEVAGVILDGAGYGPDGAIWGFEILRGGYGGCQRIGHLAYTPLPGGDNAVRHPWITAVSYLTTFLGEQGRKWADFLFDGYGDEYRLVLKMLKKGFNSPLSGGCGRLFDAVSAITGVCLESTYDGEAAIRFGELVRGMGSISELRSASYSFSLETGTINPAPLLQQLLRDVEKGVLPAEIALKFHLSIADIIIKILLDVRKTGGPGRVVLSGGCWQNLFLLAAVRNPLRAYGFDVYTHRRVPTGDGGLALGQAMIGYYSA